MKLPRRQFLHLAAGAAALPAVSRFAWAQTYPTRPVRIIVGLPAGSTGDIITRLMGEQLSERLGQPFVVENRPGAATNIATEVVVRAPPDGYTLLFVTSINAVNTTLYDRLSFNFIRDIAPVAGISRVPFVMEVNPSFPAKTVPEFIAYAKANPGKINFASSGNGSMSHIAGELFKMMAGVDMLHVPYRGDPPAITDLLAGQVQVFFSPMASSIENIKAGKLRALAVTTSVRSEALPKLKPWASSCQATRSAHRMASAHPRTRPSKSSTSSTRRSMRASPIPRSGHGSPISEAIQCRCRLSTLAGLSPMKPRNGRRSCGPRASNRID